MVSRNPGPPPAATAAAGRPAALEPGTTDDGGPLLERLRRRLRERPDSEHEQALTRLAVVPAMLAYMLWAPFPPEHEAAIRHVSWLIFAAGLTSAVLVALHILWSPGVNHPRRTWSLLADIAGIVASMLAGGTTASVFFPLLLWVILGYGFRYGRTYLILAAAGSVAAFSAVLVLSPDWRQSPFFDTAMIIALVILPFYFAVLLGKLTQAVRLAEEASRAKSHFLAAMSHEFRTPLNAVIGMGEVLATTPLDADQRDIVATVRSAAAGLL
ncbi:MAG TPA: histidine kinase dimerization/phospho-acceptor domain-containing protein, partial [Geminicoccaceae bacterium]